MAATRLKPEQLARASRLLDEALALDVEARLHWVDALPDEHADLREALRRALRLPPDGSDPADAIDHLPPAGAAFEDMACAPLHDDIVGPYRLVRRLGSGGMADVWLAETTRDGSPAHVALKLPLSSPWRPDVPSRFMLERDVLAALDHPNIARFLGSDAGDDGRPYIAMEYVAGTTLLDWADNKRLDVPRRIELLLQVLRAVQHAHEHGVLHRDLKPSNVLVTDDGVVKLLDFGVASLLGQPPRTEVTELYGAALTPGYASPELLAGEPASEASDVYSLGVMLHDLLSGPRPQAAGPPGTAGTSHVQGELGTIVLKAIARSRIERYATVEAYAADLTRWLSGERSRAKPGAVLERARRFIGQHAVGVGLASGLLLLTAAIAVPMLKSTATDPNATAAAHLPASSTSRVAASAPAPDARTAAAWLVQQADVYANGPYERDRQRAELAYAQAASMDPDNALPWSRIAALQIRRADSSSTMRERKARRQQAKDAIARALQIDPHAIDALSISCSYALHVERDERAARAALDRMRAVNPREGLWLPTCEAAYARAAGRLEESLRIQAEVAHRAPWHVDGLQALAIDLLNIGRLDEALTLMQRVRAMNPHAADIEAMVAVTMALDGRRIDALEAVSHISPSTDRQWAEAMVHAVGQQRVASEAALAALRQDGELHAYRIAQVLAQRGERRAAFDWLRKACAEPGGGCDGLRTDRFLRSLHAHAAWPTLLAITPTEDATRQSR